MQKNKLSTQRLGKNMFGMSVLSTVLIGLIVVAMSSFAYAETVSVTVNEISYDVQYTGTGVTVSAIEADPDFVSLIVNVSVADSPGTLDITLERSFFDSVNQGADVSYVVLADGDESTFSETETTTQSRTLSITLPAGTETVEIIGSVFGGTEIIAEPIAEEPVTEETPVEESIVEDLPIIDEPITEEILPIEEPIIAEIPVEESTTQCGPGTILTDGVCVLDERCGPGTILTDGICVAEPITESAPTKGLGTQLIIGLVGAFVIAGIIGLVLAIMSKASKSKK